MEKHYTILFKYQALVSEWNAISIVNAILFGVSILGILLGLVYNHMPAVGLATVLMVVFAAFEYKTRKKYVTLKLELEEEMYKLAGLKKPKTEDMIRKGLWY
jgi:TRAP-type C4-dicarboxylate transport system permease small subunit